MNAQSGKANILLLSEQLGVPLNGAQAQQLIDTNTAMIDGGGFTASEVSFRLACMKVLGTLPDLFTVRTWRVFDESDEAGKRFVQAFMSLGIGDAIVTARAEGEGPVDALTRAMRRELDKHYPALQKMRLGRFSVTAIDVSAHDSAARVRVTVSFTADGLAGQANIDPVDHRGRLQRHESGRAECHRGRFSTTGCSRPARRLQQHRL